MSHFPEGPVSWPSSSSELLFGTRAHSFVLASGRQISSAALFHILNWSGWFIFGAIPFVWILSSWGFLGSLLNNLIFVLCGALMCQAMRVAYRRARRRKLSYLILAPLVLLACSVLAEVWYVVELIVARWSFNQLAAISSLHAQFAFGAGQLAKGPLLISVYEWFLNCSALLTWSSLYFGVNSMMDLELEKARAAHALKLADSAQLRVLQSQLNPHFLFNALNGVATLVRENKGPTAARMISTLSDFLRATLRTVNVPEIPVSEELVFIDQYIELQQLRFADRLAVTVDATEESCSALVPTLILQPLVENAVQHGVLTQERGGSVAVSIKKSEEYLLVTVDDDGPGPASLGAQRFGVGLANTAERLHALYGDEATMSTGRSTRGGFVVELRLPFRERKKESVMSMSAAVAQ